MSDLATVEKLAEAVAAYYGGKILKVEETIVVKTDSDKVSAMLNMMGVTAGVPSQYSLTRLETTIIPPKLEVNVGDWVAAEETPPQPSHATQEREETQEETDSEDDPPMAGMPRRVCRNCMRLFYPKRNASICCSTRCYSNYNTRSTRVVAINKQYVYKNQHRHWFYGDEEWFKARLESGTFHEGARVITPEGNVRIIRFTGGKWCFDEMVLS